MARKNYSEAIKAAVMAALLTGQSVSSVASEYKIPKGTVSGWKRKAEDLTDGGVASTATQKDKSNVGESLLNYLMVSLRTLTAQAEHFGDKAWLAKQDADQLAVLHGVHMDKAIRLMEAFGNAGVQDSND